MMRAGIRPSWWIAYWNILVKDVRAYYLKPPNISWGILFPLAWTAMFLIRSGGSMEDVRALLPGIMSLSVLFGTTSMLAVTVTFERKGRSFDRLLLAPLPLEMLMAAKTSGAIAFGVLNCMIPFWMASFFYDLSGASVPSILAAGAVLSVVCTFMGLFIAVSVKEVFEAQTLSNFFRFPMLFLCGLFFPVSSLPIFLRPLSYMLPLTYGVDLMRWILEGQGLIPVPVDWLALVGFASLLFMVSLRSIRKRWIQ
jgi:ABC-2 type transport system permease protein